VQRYWLIPIILCAILILLFLLAEAVDVPILNNPQPWLESSRSLASIIGVGLLVADVVLPIPSSLIMFAHGALFGTLLGTCLNLVGSAGAMIAGFAIGRSGGPLFERFVPREEQERADHMLKKWGILAIIISRPVPILAETVSILAGASSLSWRRATFAALAGVLPGSFLYALAGEYSQRPEYGIAIFGFNLVLAGLLWLVGRTRKIISVKK
jgi:uncharacterized membrane protein YdjX (TVP38/TMEM64 family)